MEELFEARTYWLDRLRASGTTPPLSFWRARADEALGDVEVELDAAAVARLQALTGGQPLLHAAAVVASVHAALALQTGAAQAVVAVPARKTGASEPTPNLLPIVQAVNPDSPFRELLGQVRRSLLDAFAVQDYPLRPLCEELGAPEGPAEVGVVLEGFGGEFDPHPPVLLRVSADERRVRIRVETRRPFAPDALRVFAERVARILSAGVLDHGTKVGRLALPSEQERETVLSRWNDTAAAVPPGSVVTWIEQQAAARPDAVALAGERDVTYRQMNERADRLARRLRGLGVGREARVGLYLDDPEDMVVSLLGVLKAGAAYVPLDPSYPRARVEHMVADSAPRVVITTGALERELPPSAARTLTLPLADDAADAAPGPTPAASHGRDQLAYVIYTSGSTGAPRGVLVEHGGFANTIHYFASLSGVDETSRVSQFCSFSFDASVLEIFVALTRGATLYLAPRAVRGSGTGLGAFLRENKITVIGAVTPAVLSLIDPADAKHVRAIHIGAEKCPAELADRWGAGRLLVNCYGPTEATIDCICAPCVPGEGDPPIGRPIANARAYVLDGDLRPAPVGVVGELYVGGDAVTRGYQNLPGVTAAKFVPDHLGGQPGGRLYRSGDLARWRSDGRLDFCGRADRQVKIDGLRIEPGEIEAALAAHPAIAQCAVDVRADKGGQRVLVAYVVPRVEMPSPQALREHLSLSVPAYMLPSAFVALDRMPTTANGKIDRRALPDPRPPGGAGADPTAPAPNGEIERALAGIWSEVLGAESVDPDSSFFDLGGRSLHVTRVLSKLAKRYQVELPLEAMFRTPKLSDFARVIAAAVAERPAASDPQALVPPAPRPERLPLSSAQQRLWFLQQVLPPESAALYNGPLPVLLQGALDRDALLESFRAIIDRHEVLRTAFRVVDDSPVQVILPRLDFAIDFVDASALPEAERVAEANRLAEADAHRTFDLEHPPLLRATLVKLGEAEHVLLLNIHHIVFDGWSAAVLLNELTRCYDAFSRGGRPDWEPLPIQYADFALWQRRWLESPAFDQQLGYWRKQLAGLPELQLPTTAARPERPTYKGAIETFRLSPALRAGLEALSREADVTLFMTLLAGFKALLHRYTAQEDVAVGSPVANRNRAELEHLIGFFVNSVVLRTDLSAAPTFRELLGRVRKVTLEAYDHQNVPFEKLVEHLQPERVATHNPLFRAALSLQNVPLRPRPSRDLRITPWETHNKTTKFDLVFAMTDDGDAVVGDVEYSPELFERATIREMIGFYERLLAWVAAHPDAKIIDVPLGELRPAPAPPLEVTTFDF